MSKLFTLLFAATLAILTIDHVEARGSGGFKTSPPRCHFVVTVIFGYLRCR